MDWLNGWVKELILIILLASFTDLLLPSHALQRYVRTVIGLFLLLVLLSPIYELFHQRWTPEQWIQSALGPSQIESESKLEPLSAIVQKSNELKTANQKQVKQLLESQLAVSMKASIENYTAAEVDRLSVNTEFDHNGKPTITEVQLALSLQEAGDSSNARNNPQAKAGIAIIEPVKPVIIDMKVENTLSAVQTVPAQTEPLTSLQKQVEAHLEKEWQLHASQIYFS